MHQRSSCRALANKTTDLKPLTHGKVDDNLQEAELRYDLQFSANGDHVRHAMAAIRIVESQPPEKLRLGDSIAFSSIFAYSSFGTSIAPNVLKCSVVN